ncbi:MAG: 5'-nucleotidase, partial [Chlorobi bacterium OLB5]
MNFLKLILILFGSLIFVPNCISQWVLAANGLANTTCMSLGVNENTMFVIGVNGTVYSSTNSGNNWTPSFSYSSELGNSLFVNGNNIFASYFTYGLFYSSNNGAQWNPTALNDRTVNVLTANSSRTFAGTSNYGVYYSSNNGLNWFQTSLNDKTVRALTVKGDTIFAGTNTYGVYISTDNGTSWTQTSLNNQHINSLTVYENTIYAGSNGVYISTSNGANWTQIGLSNQSIWGLAVYGNTIFAGSYTTGIYVSYDNGATWTPRNEGINTGLNIRSFCILDNYIFTTPQSRVYRRPLSELTGIQPVSNETPNLFYLSQNYPNPFNPVTKIKFDIPSTAFVKLIVYDVQGKEISALLSKELNAGTYSIDFDGSSLSSGVYFYKLTSGNYH